MSDYLLEVGVEELPAGFVDEACGRLRDLLSMALEQNLITYRRIDTLSTPRRLTAIVRDIAPMQATAHKRIKGPAVKSAFDADGKPTKQAQGFAEKHKLQPADLKREEVGGIEYLMAEITNEGLPTAEILPGLIEKIIPQISGERLMRWGTSDIKFSRPLRWLVSLMDDKVVPIKIANLTASNQSLGHRILHPSPVTIGSAASYVDDLKKAHVMVSADERRSLIREQVNASAAQLKGRPRKIEESSLLDEVVNLTEWPKAVVGQFEDEYLSLPSTLIETIMVHHQRYFSVEAHSGVDEFGDKQLLPYFITISNNDRDEAMANIKQGNERVLRARLADGKFFFFDDLKCKLEDRKEGLSALTYQEGLGSYADKVDRVVALAKVLADTVELDAKTKVCLERAVQLMKLDLVSNLVRELPELQGYVGSWYAKKAGEPKEVTDAIASHYSPRSAHDAIPSDKVGALAAVLDKLDHIVGLFALGKKPTGSSDVFGLRRSAQGLVDILIDGLSDTRVDLDLLIQNLLKAYEPMIKSNKDDCHKEIKEFVGQRLRGKLLDRGHAREIVEATLTSNSNDAFKDLTDLIKRIEAIKNLMTQSQGQNLIKAAIRVGNIVDRQSGLDVETALLTVPAEKQLWEAIVKVKGQITKDQSHDALLSSLLVLTEPIEKFFEDTMVNDPDAAKKANRHKLLKNIDDQFSKVADFTKLQALVN